MDKQEYKPTVFSRICKILEEKGIEPPKFQEKLGIQSQHWNNWKNRRVPPKEIFRIAEMLDINSDWLATGAGEKYKNQSYTNLINEPEVKGEVPEVSFAQIGEWSETSFNLLPVDGVRMIKSRVPVMARTFAVTVEGDSMEPEFVEGDTIIVEPSLSYKHKSYVIAKNGKDVFLRQIVKEGSDWLLKPLNKRYDILPLGEYQIVGVIREKAKFYE